MTHVNRLSVATGLSMLPVYSFAGIDFIPIDSPPTLSLMALGIIGAVLVARFMNR